MTRAVAGVAFAVVLVLLAVFVGLRALERRAGRAGAAAAAVAPTAPAAGAEAPPAASQGFLYGRVTTVGGVEYAGRLRWGGGEEAFWSDYFNGFKAANPWTPHVPPERLVERRPLEVFGLEIARRDHPLEMGRRFMARFGDLARIESRGQDVRVTLKSGTTFVLDRLEAGDFDDGVRVWDGERGVVDLGPRQIRAIELLPTPKLAGLPGRLHGTVRTRQGDFSGFVQWDREECVGTDELDGRTAEGELGLRFDTLRAIARAGAGVRVTLRDGREVALSGTGEVGPDNRGIYVDDGRYGRVLVSWDAFERLDFDDPGQSGSGPAYGDFPPGRPLTGSVVTRAGRRLAGRLVYDLDESETTETLDAPARGVDYTLPFGRIATIVPGGGEAAGAGPARVILDDGEVLELERDGDLGAGNAGLLVFVDGRDGAEHVPWTDVERIDLDR